MPHCFEYAVLRVIPDPRRGECVNIGLVVFLEDRLDVRILPSLAKLTALDGGIDQAYIRDLPTMLHELTNGHEDVNFRHSLLQRLGIVTVSSLGDFELQSNSDYDRLVDQLMKGLVTPVPPAREVLANNTRLTTSLKAKFRTQNILGQDIKDIAKHLVVPNYPIDEDEGLYADFVLKNGAYHVTETADLRADSASRQDRFKVASVTAIKLDKAKQSFGKKTKRFVVFASKSAAGIQQQINLMGDYSDYIYNLESKSDMAAYMNHMMAAATANRSLRLAKRE
jgi:hypothetical protein